MQLGILLRDYSRFYVAATLANYRLLFDRQEKTQLVCHSSCQSIQTMEHEFYECPEYLSNTPAEVERTEEYEYEVQF